MMRAICIALMITRLSRNLGDLSIASQISLLRKASEMMNIFDQ
jgi:hypothetical protein